MIARLFRSVLRPAIVVPAAIAGLSVVELAIADRKYGTFSGGFGQSASVDDAGEYVAFLIGYAIAQIAAGLVAWRVAAWLARRGGDARAMVHFAFLFGGIGLAALTAQYQLHSYFSDAVSFALLKQLGGGSAADALLFARHEIALALLALALLGAAWWLAARLAGRLDPAEHSRPTRPGWRWIAWAWGAFLLAIVLIPRLPGDAARNLDRMLAWQAVTDAAAAATDVDRDGYGLVGLQIDNHPFDSARHPLALDIPGDGVDQDGFGGDLTLVPVPRPLPPTPVSGTRPNLAIVVMESTRADAVGKRIDGRLVAPNLTRLAREGGAVVPAYSHVGFTTESLKSIFTGALTVAPGAPSLFRDLKASGYRISVFSGQPEDFGGISEATGMRASAGDFVDAERLKDQRAFSFAAQGSLLVDEDVILDQFRRRLGTAQAWAGPRFVYFNFQSPHFPYNHPGVPEAFAHPPLARGAITAEHRAQVERTYWNAVAHADAALGAVIAQLKRVGVWDDTVLLVSGDHGESLFEDGFLGHGHRIGPTQNATFLVGNRPLPDVHAPIGLNDYRRIALSLLGAPVPPARRFAPFMHIGVLDRPTAIGTTDPRFGVISLRLDSGEACFEPRAGDRACRPYARLTGAKRAAIDRLIARWGSERWAARAQNAATR